jgi:hypothetical protein
MSKKQAPLTELRDVEVERVDAVKGAANGTRFLIAKQASGEVGLVSADNVRELLAEDEPGDVYRGPAGEVIKAEMGTSDINDLPDSDFAYIEPGGAKDDGGRTVPRGNRHFPIQDAAHVRNALARLSTSPLEAKARPKVEAAARRMGIGEPAQVAKESLVTTPAATAEKTPAAVAGPDLKEAKAVLKAAKLAKKVRKADKAALFAKAAELGLKKGALSNLADAHEAVLETVKHMTEEGKDTSKYEGLAGEIASMMSDHAAGADEPDDGEEAAVEKSVKPVSLKKARKAAKAAKLAKQAARDEIAASKARQTLVKIGRRNSTPDQKHLDAADEHIGALGATFHQQAKPVAAVVKASEPDDTAADVIALIQKAVGPLVDKDREAIRGELAQVREQVAKMAKAPLPGGPRVVLDRDGSIIPAPDGTPGLSVGVAMLQKMADTAKDPVEREALSKAAAREGIKELQARQAAG